MNTGIRAVLQPFPGTFAGQSGRSVGKRNRPGGYPRIEAEAQAGAETVSLTWETAEDWRLGFGAAGAGYVTCDGTTGCVTTDDTTSVGWTLDFHFYHPPESFGIHGPALALSTLAVTAP